MNRYRASLRGPNVKALPFPATPGPPRSFVEWATLRRWEKLPEGELDISGFLLRLAREEAGLTQKELAERLGISQPAVAQAERWVSNPTAATMRRWAAACRQGQTVK